MSARKYHYWHNCGGVMLTKAEVMSCSGPGPADAAVSRLLTKPHIRAQVALIPCDELRRDLKEYGAWEDDELRVRGVNLERFLWLSACAIREEKRWS